MSFIDQSAKSIGTSKFLPINIKSTTEVIWLGFDKGIFSKNQPGFGLLAGDLTGVAGTGSSCDSDMDRNNESLRSPAGVGTGTSFSLRDADLKKDKTKPHKSRTNEKRSDFVRLNLKKNVHQITSNNSDNMYSWQRFA